MQAISVACDRAADLRGGGRYGVERGGGSGKELRFRERPAGDIFNIDDRIVPRLRRWRGQSTNVMIV